MPTPHPKSLDALAEATGRLCGKVDAIHRQLVVTTIGAVIVGLLAVVGQLGV